jgi:hypothetical protein
MGESPRDKHARAQGHLSLRPEFFFTKSLQLLYPSNTPFGYPADKGTIFA